MEVRFVTYMEEGHHAMLSMTDVLTLDILKASQR